jgi:hypothetical protein
LRNEGQVAKRDLHAHALRAEPAWVAHEAAHGLAFGDEAAQEGRSDEPGGAGEQEHRPKLAEWRHDRSIVYVTDPQQATGRHRYYSSSATSSPPQRIEKEANGLRNR